MLSQQEEVGVVLAAREYLYLLFTRAFGQEPDKALLAALHAPETSKALWLFVEEPIMYEYQTIVKYWNDSSSDNEAALLDSMKSEYIKALIGPEKLTAYPWESSYVEDAPLLFQKSTLEVRNAFKRSGLELVLETNVPDDHLAFELLFMSHMTTRSLEALAEENAEALHSLLEQQLEFLNSHILKWVPQYCSDLQKLSTKLYLPVLAELLRVYVLSDQHVLEECLTQLS